MFHDGHRTVYGTSFVRGAVVQVVLPEYYLHFARKWQFLNSRGGGGPPPSVPSSSVTTFRASKQQQKSILTGGGAPFIKA